MPPESLEEKIAALSTKLDIIMDSFKNLNRFVNELNTERENIDKRLVVLAEELKNFKDDITLKINELCKQIRKCDDIVDKYNKLEARISKMEGRVKSFKYVWTVIAAILSALFAWISFHIKH